jgi:NAD(P)-dependent dehydrogenase (short-subunit alcohol dehydrogenase family)
MQCFFIGGSMENKIQKVAIVTGASSGIGEATAIHLASLGYRVFGTSRKGDNGKTKGQFELLPLDVTNDESVESLVKTVMAKTGRIDVLVNNAGIGVAGGAEESSLEQVHSIFDTNVYGMIRMIKATLPHMRNQKEGRIINVSSIVGKIPAPFMAVYSSTKHAVEGYSESLDHEIRQFGIRSILIEPAYTKTQFDQSSSPADSFLDIYKKNRKVVSEIIEAAMQTGDPAEEVAHTIAKALSDVKPKVRYTSGSKAGQLAKMRRFLPTSMFDSGIRKIMKLD